jgi:hypothetical protein
VDEEKISPAPVIVIGAARSGTNMLRNVLTSLPGFVTWPCDELPFIWKHGWRDFPHDEFTQDMATPRVRKFLAKQFQAIQTLPDDVVVEKTCANSLRLGFVARAVPGAKFLIIVRQPHDAIASAMLRWTGQFDLRYSLAKARYVPVTDIPYYGLKYLRNRMGRLFSREKQLGYWGPVFKGMDQERRRVSLAQLATMQWARCMERTLADLDIPDTGSWMMIRYEEFVSEPTSEFQKILEFLGHTKPLDDLAAATATVKADSVGKGLRKLSATDKAAIDLILENSSLPREYVRNGTA